MLVDNLNGHGELQELVRRIETLERATPLNNASIGRSGLLIYDGGSITIENGGLKITGTGSLDGAGTFTWTGTVNLDGPVIIDGEVNINGILKVLEDALLRANLVVDAGGQITVKGTNDAVLGITSLGRPGLQIGASSLSSTGSGMGIIAGSSAAVAAGDYAGIRFGTNQVITTADGVFIDNLPTTSNPPNIYADANGKLYRSTGIAA